VLKPARDPRVSRHAGAVSDRKGHASASRVAGNATRIGFVARVSWDTKGLFHKIVTFRVVKIIQSAVV
jgi:hypothetical protein